eukprot:m.155275 g.155275  ORF g.155275 m.155275 type:complete len:223 (+) comp14309_c0_seq2:218-886(+)
MSSSPAKRKVAGEAVEGTKKAKENVNKDICAFLNELADFEKNVSRHMHKHNAYRKASRAVAVYPKRITSGKEAKKLEGVGEKIAKKIDEFLATGKLEKLEKIHANPHHKAIQLFASIVGFGPVAAQRYVAEGITTIEELVKQDTLTATQRIGVQHFEDFAKRIPRAEVDQLKAKVNLQHKHKLSSSSQIIIIFIHALFYFCRVYLVPSKFRQTHFNVVSFYL